MTGFSAVDYAVLLLYLVEITVFGTLFRRSQRTVKDYFLGAKNISWIVISLSIVATETSTLTLIGMPALAYSTFARREQGGNLTYLQTVSGLSFRAFSSACFCVFRGRIDDRLRIAQTPCASARKP
jgi:hypothetical protein